MPRMGADTVAMLRAAVADPVTVARYWSHVRRVEIGCWLWTGAIAGKGHGRFQLGDTYLLRADGTRRRKTFVVIAHRFGFALEHGVDALLEVPIVAHWCDTPPCQRPEHWRPSDHVSNGREYGARRAEVLGALADVRGARGRARAVRDAARAGDDEALVAALLAGAQPIHRAQEALFGEPARSYTLAAHPAGSAAGASAAWPVTGADGAVGQPGLFDIGDPGTPGGPDGALGWSAGP